MRGAKTTIRFLRAASMGTLLVAAVAAGFVAGRHRKPWSSPLAIGVNYLAGPEALYVPAGDGVLDKR